MRFDITRLLAPTAIKPRTSGPREADGNAPGISTHRFTDKPQHRTPQAANVNPPKRTNARQISPKRTPPPAAPAPPSTTNRITLLEPTNMPRTRTQGKVLAALTEKSPLTREALQIATEYDTDTLSNAIYNLKKKGLISGSRDQYQLVKGASSSARKAKPAKPSAPKHIPRGPTAPTFAARLAEITNAADQFYIGATQTRAIATADGGAILLERGYVVVELTKSHVTAIRALDVAA